MKNMRVSTKLITGFLIAAVLTVTVGAVGIAGMTQINGALSAMYDDQTEPMPYMAKIQENLQRERACMREYIIGAAVGDMDLIEDAHNRAENYEKIVQEQFPLYRATIRSDSALRLFDEAVNLYNTSFRECEDRIYQGAKNGGDAVELYALMRTYTDDINKVVADFGECLDLKVQAALTADTDSDNLFVYLLTSIIIVLVAAITIALFLAFYISGLISKPLVVLSSFMNRAGTTGNVITTREEEEALSAHMERKDEIGQTMKNCGTFIDHVVYIAEEPKSLAGGDLTIETKVISKEDTMGIAVENLVDNLNKMFGDINTASDQVSTGAKQIADGAQALAQGSTQQAATVQELSASTGEIADKTKANAHMAGQAASLADTIKGNAEKGSRQMDEMMSAVNEINQASQNISKVISVIDNIAFQTNILALNASVEAARAGQHGKGFAVVAEEVRNLAAKSAEAAKDTGDLIANSMQKAEHGATIAKETAASLEEIVSGINESSGIISEIASSSELQTVGITQINDGIDQVAQVVQQNSATAEESAAASEELSGQAELLGQLIAQFKLKHNGGRKPAVVTSQYSSGSTDFALSGNFGKY